MIKNSVVCRDQQFYTTFLSSPFITHSFETDSNWNLLNTIFIVYFYFLNWMFDFCWLCRAACRSQAINAGYVLYKSKVGKAGYSNIIKRLCTLVCYARWHQNAKIWMWNIKTFLWCLYSVAEYIWDMYFSLLCTVALHKT